MELFKLNLFLKLFGLFKIPLLFLAGPKITHLNDQKIEIKIPLNWRTRNHLKSLYFGTLAIGADCCAGFLATKFIMQSKKKVHLSFKDFEAQFLKRAESDTYFICEQGHELKNFVDQVISHPNERSNFPVIIRAETRHQAETLVVATFVLTLSLKYHQ